MILDLTFSKALALFTVLMTLVYLTLLIFSEKITKSQNTKSSTRDATLKVLFVCLFSVEALTISLLHVPSFRTSIIYFAFALSTLCLILYALRFLTSSKRIWSFILISAVVFHIILLYSPPFGMVIAEGTDKMAKLGLYGHWDESFGLHPTYWPFPVALGLSVITSMVTSVHYTIPILGWAIGLPLIIAYDLVLYALTKRITGSQVAGILAILILALIPPANIMSHVPKWTGSMLVLVSALALCKAFDGLSPTSNIIISFMSYLAAIFFHASASIGMFLPLSVVLVSYSMKWVMKNRTWEKYFKSGAFRTGFTLFALITLTRSIYTAGYLESTLPPIKHFLLAMLGFASPSEAGLPVYEQTVSPINAYAWSTPVAIATAFMIYVFWKRKGLGGTLTLAMYFVGGTFAFLGFLVAIVGAGFSVPMYVAFAFLIPAAAFAGKRLLSSNRAVAYIFICLIVLSAGIALTDPMFSNQRYKEIGAGDIMAGTEDYAEASFLVDVIPTDKHLMAPYEISSSFSYLAVAENKSSYIYHTSSADLQRIVIDSLVNDKKLLSGTRYIWPERWHPDIISHLSDMQINVYYDCDRHVVFDSAIGK